MWEYVTGVAAWAAESDIVWNCGIAIALVLMLTQAAARLSIEILNYRYDRSKGTKVEKRLRLAELRRQYTIPEPTEINPRYNSEIEAETKTLIGLHRAAKSAKEAYHIAAARCVSAAGFALVALALSITVFNKSATFKGVAAPFDAFALLFSWWQWRIAKVRSRIWVEARTRAEILRQRIPMAILFDLNGAAPAESALGQVNLGAIERNLRPHSGTSVVTYWQKLRADCSDRGLSPSNAWQDFQQYLSTRVIPQLDECISQQSRLKMTNRSREKALSWAFWAAITLALLKMVSQLQSPHIGAVSYIDAILPAKYVAMYLSAGAMSLAALSTTLSALYMGRNDRSLSHRYAAHQRQIEAWLQAQSRGEPDQSFKATDLDAILSFEDIMIDEHIDWMHITLRDIVEPG